MMEQLYATPEELISHFRTVGELKSIAPYGNGHINDTYLVLTLEEGQERRYVLQRLSPVAFKKPGQVMENIARVTSYLRDRVAARGGDPSRATLTLVPTHEGEAFWMDESGAYWRVYLNVDRAVSYQLPENPQMMREAGRAFGDFQTELAAYPIQTLHETIPNFHATPHRVQALEDAVAGDAAGRLSDVAEEVFFALERKERAGALVRMMSEGTIPLRVTHNDTKLNNVLLDRDTGEGLCVIDLDTVMPGLCAYDFGDAIRFGANTAEEDEADLSKVALSMPMFQAYAEGYLDRAGSVLWDEEIRSLPLGAWMMTYECGIRFLADHLNGDIYFHVRYPGHNLIRARNQFALLRDMERRFSDMEAVMSQWMAERGRL